MEDCMYSSIKSRRSASSTGEEQMSVEEMPLVSLCRGTKNKENMNKRYHKRPRLDYKSPQRIAVKYPLVGNGESKIRKHVIRKEIKTETLIQREINEKNRKLDLKSCSKTRRTEVEYAKNLKLSYKNYKLFQLISEENTSRHQPKAMHQKNGNISKTKIDKRNPLSSELQVRNRSCLLPVTDHGSINLGSESAPCYYANPDLEWPDTESDQDDGDASPKDSQNTNNNTPKLKSNLQNDDVVFAASSTQNSNEGISRVDGINSESLPNKNAITAKCWQYWKKYWHINTDVIF